MSMKNSNNAIENRTRDHPACNARLKLKRHCCENLTSCECLLDDFLKLYIGNVAPNVVIFCGTVTGPYKFLKIPGATSSF